MDIGIRTRSDPCIDFQQSRLPAGRPHPARIAELRTYVEVQWSHRDGDEFCTRVRACGSIHSEKIGLDAFGADIVYHIVDACEHNHIFSVPRFDHIVFEAYEDVGCSFGWNSTIDYFP